MNNEIYHIYIAKNKINGMAYVGNTVNFEKRILMHKESASKDAPFKFQKALKKYGMNNFEWNIIETCDSLNIANEKERYYIKLYDTITNGYNIKTGGRGRIKKLYGNLVTQNISINIQLYNIITREATINDRSISREIVRRVKKTLIEEGKLK